MVLWDQGHIPIMHQGLTMDIMRAHIIMAVSGTVIMVTVITDGNASDSLHSKYFWSCYDL